MNNFNNFNNYNNYNNNYNNFNNYNGCNSGNTGGNGWYNPNFGPNGNPNYNQQLYYQQQAKAQRRQIRSLGNIIGGCVLAFLAVQLFASLLLSADSAFYQKYQSSSVFQDCFGIIFVEVLALAVPFGLAAAINKKKLSGPLVPSRQMPFSQLCLWVGAGMLCCVGADYVVGILSMLSKSTGFELTQPETPDPTNAFACLISLVATAIVPAICEEFSLRCCALGIVKKYGKAFGVVAVSIVFGLIHGNIIQFIFATLVGLILGYVTVRTDSVVPAIFIHGFNNAMSVISSIFQYAVSEKAGEIAGYVLFGFWIATGAICVVILALKKQIIFKLDERDNTPYANTTAQKFGAFFSSPVLILSAAYFVVSVIMSIKKV